jgi:hypothetical protein
VAKEKLVKLVFLCMVCVMGVCGSGFSAQYRALSSSEKDIDTVKYNEVQFKALRNITTKKEIRDFLYSSSEKKNSRGEIFGIELNLAMEIIENDAGDKKTAFFAAMPSLKIPLEEILGEIQQWGVASPGHHVVTIYFNITEEALEGGDKAFCRDFDAMLVASLTQEKIYSPAYLLRDGDNLLHAIKEYGWPALKELRESYVVVLTGDDTDGGVARRRMIYSLMHPYRRKAFVDIDSSVAVTIKDGPKIRMPYFSDGMRVFFSVSPEEIPYLTTLKEHENLAGVVTRISPIINDAQWEVASKTAANIIVTDVGANNAAMAFVEEGLVDGEEEDILR